MRPGKKLNGYFTISDICKKLNMQRQSAIDYVSKLRKAGYVHRTIYTKPERTYLIRQYRKAAAQKGLTDVLNSLLPANFQLQEKYEQYVWGEYPPEKAFVDTLKTRKARFVLASIILFRKIKDWKLLFKYAKGNRRKAGALYDLARREMPKIRRMDKRTYTALLKSPKESPYFVGKAEASADYLQISKKWGVFIPFSREDVRRIL